MKTWREAFDRTWLADPQSVFALDNWVRRKLVEHRRLGDDDTALQSVAPWSVATLVHSIGKFGDLQQWLWCLTGFGLLQELVFCAEGGGLDPTGIATDRDLAGLIEALRAVRNAVMHPAFQNSKGGNDAPMGRLIEFLEADDDPEVAELATRLFLDWSHLAASPATMYALRKMHAAGKLFIERNRLVKTSR